MKHWKKVGLSCHFGGVSGPESERIVAGGRRGSMPLTDSAPSPIYGHNKTGLPPIPLTSGTRDLFLSDVARLQCQLIDARASVDLTGYDGDVACFPDVNLVAGVSHRMAGYG